MAGGEGTQAVSFPGRDPAAYPPWAERTGECSHRLRQDFSVFLGGLIQYINERAQSPASRPGGLRLLWITPLRALAKDIGRAMKK